jgi:hypothetical protein
VAGESGTLKAAGLTLDVDLPRGWPGMTAKERGEYSSIKLDRFHEELLNSSTDSALVHGLLSVRFWGFVSGTDGGLREALAMRRTRWVVEGKAKGLPQPVAEIVSHLRTARSCLADDRPAQALVAVLNIKHFGMSFASKVVAFMNPRVAAVYDQVISERLRLAQDRALSDVYVSVKPAASKREQTRQAEKYEQWCRFCARKAKELVQDGYIWEDWNGDRHCWRAIDVERAYFALGKSGRKEADTSVAR